ncbi:flavin-containing monooxygenase [Nocardioides alkalitolerans]|uniref:flavin-containing monooxygenase n=1 Tax=Nocardioides alkalitolerans TaxID=281714 RepID=UPI00040C8FFE|nr:NAD(P)/FAD-dependent oxidoreductase [Nocardioides alkalitolerans]
MIVEETTVVVVGAGQAGIAASAHLSDFGVAHVVLERGRVAEQWRTGRWDSLVANGPAWHDRFPGLEFDDLGPDQFASKERVASYFEAYAEKIAAPVRCGVEVLCVTRRTGVDGFVVETSTGTIHARFVIAATGPFHHPVVPTLVPERAPVQQIHSHTYRNPSQLAPGGVIVVGAGSSGVQIADELRRAGREVYLSVGPHDRPPRSYRGRDFCWWLGVLGLWDAETPPEGASHVTIAVSGARGGHTVDFRELSAAGIGLVGMTASYDQGVLRFEDDLADNISQGDANYTALLDAADAYVERTGIDLPPEPQARDLGPDPEALRNPRRELDLAASGVSTIIWATGFRQDFGWLDAEADALDAAGRPVHRRGVGAAPGIYFLGLPWLSRRGSSFIWGVWHDARHVVDHLVTQLGYLEYQAPTDLAEGTIR